MPLGLKVEERRDKEVSFDGDENGEGCGKLPLSFVGGSVINLLSCDLRTNLHNKLLTKHTRKRHRSRPFCRSQKIGGVGEGTMDIISNIRTNGFNLLVNIYQRYHEAHVLIF